MRIKPKFPIKHKADFETLGDKKPQTFFAHTYPHLQMGIGDCFEMYCDDSQYEISLAVKRLNGASRAFRLQNDCYERVFKNVVVRDKKKNFKHVLCVRLEDKKRKRK